MATLAALLSGDLDHDIVRTEIVPHLAASCPTCARHLDRIHELGRHYDHWNELIAVEEGLAAAGLLEDLLADDDQESRLARLDDEDELHSWGLAQELLHTSHHLLFENPVRAVEVAELAVRVVEHLPGSAYHEDWLADLRARAWAHLGNARRVVGELRSAEADLRHAFTLLRRRGTGRPRVEAELRDLLTSLRLTQRRYEEALEELETAVRLYGEAGDEHRIGRSQLKRAKILEEQGHIDEAIAVLEALPDLLAEAREPRLLLCARLNLLYCLAEAKRLEPAERLLAEVRSRYGDDLQDVDRHRLRWIEGRMAEEAGDPWRAEHLFAEVQRFFLDRRLDLDAALVSLELAVLYAADGRHRELRELAQALMPLFRSKDLHREVLSVLHLWRRAVEENGLTHQVALELAAVLRRRPVSV